MSNIPADLKYAKSHEWVKVDGSIAIVGITDFAQSELGDVVFVELPEVGRVLQRGETFGSVESVKTVSDVYAPVTGKVVDTNVALGAQSELINSDPYEKGFLLKIEMENSSDLELLLDAAGYKAIVE